MTQPTLIRKTDAADKAKGIYETYGVTASEVRAWAKLNLSTPVPDRGRLHPDVLNDFAAAMESQTA